MLIEIKEESKQVSDAEAAAEIFRSILSAESEVDQDKEHFWIIGLDSKKIILYIELVALGTLNNILVHPREVFRMAILKAAASIMAGHNHPSGSLEASSEDRFLTERLIKAGEILGIKLLDHIVIGNNKPGCFSFHRKGFLGEDLKGSLNQSQFEKGGMEMEKVMESGLNMKDIFEKLDESRNNVVCHAYDLETIIKISDITALEYSEGRDKGLNIEWVSVFNVMKRVMEDIHKELTTLERYIWDLKQQISA